MSDDALKAILKLVGNAPVPYDGGRVSVWADNDKTLRGLLKAIEVIASQAIDRADN